MKSIIEHVVLFKIKEEASEIEIQSFVGQVNSLISLEHPLHLTMGPLTTIQSSSLPSLNFTHILHIRFTSKEDLHAYAVHPTHVSVVNDNKSLVVDKMALDWVTEVHDDDFLLPVESALRVVFFKLKEGLREEVKEEVLKGVNGIQRGKVVQFTCGENFSDGRSKGFSIGSLAVFPGLRELKEVDSDEEFRKYDKIKENLDTVLLLDYVGHGQTAS